MVYVERQLPGEPRCLVEHERLTNTPVHERVLRMPHVMAAQARESAYTNTFVGMVVLLHTTAGVPHGHTFGNMFVPNEPFTTGALSPQFRHFTCHCEG